MASNAFCQMTIDDIDTPTSTSPPARCGVGVAVFPQGLSLGLLIIAELIDDQQCCRAMVVARTTRASMGSGGWAAGACNTLKVPKESGLTIRTCRGLSRCSNGSRQD